MLILLCFFSISIYSYYFDLFVCFLYSSKPILIQTLHLNHKWTCDFELTENMNSWNWTNQKYDQMQ